MPTNVIHATSMVAKKRTLPKIFEESSLQLWLRLFVLRARCNVMARLTKTLKKELKSVSLPGTLGHTCEFVRSHIEAVHGNHRKSIKMLNSVVQMAGKIVEIRFF